MSGYYGKRIVITESTGIVQATINKVQSTWKIPLRLINNISSIETKKMAAPRKPYAIWLIPIYVEWWMILIKRAVRKVAAKNQGYCQINRYGNTLGYCIRKEQ